MKKLAFIIIIGVLGVIEATPEQVAAADAWYWAYYNQIKLVGGVFTAKDHEYQIKPMQSEARVTVERKGTQGGWTEKEILRILWGMIHGHYPQGVLYLFPTGKDVSKFSRSRFNPLIEDNYDAIGRYVQSTDSTELKRIGKAFLFLHGARLNQKIRGAEKEASQLRSDPVDKVVFDEFDLMDPMAVAKALARMGHSHIKEEAYISNPTIPDYGVDAKFTVSSQEFWHIKCQKCNEWTSPDEEFPNCVAIRSNGTGYLQCKKCGSEIFIRHGDYVAKCPSETEIIGRHWSQLTSAYVDPATIVRAYDNPPDGNIGDVHRLMLGRPYIEAENRLTMADVYNCCGPEAMLMSHKGPCAMGVDIGKVLHVIIGYKRNDKQFVLVKICEVPDWNACHDLAQRFNVPCEVQDIAPETHMCRKYQAAESHAVFLCRYSDTQTTSAQYNLKEQIVTVNRTEVCDATHRLVTGDKTLEIPRRCDAVDEFANHCVNTAKAPFKDDLTGAITYRYVRLDGPDHYRHALNYFLLAAKRISPVLNKFSKGKQTKADNDWISLG